MEISSRARRVSFDREGESLSVELLNGMIIIVPTRFIQILKDASAEEIRDVELPLDGLFLRWPRLDEDLRIQSLVDGTFGTAKWMSGINEIPPKWDESRP